MAIDNSPNDYLLGSARTVACLLPVLQELAGLLSVRTFKDILRLWSRLQSISGDPYPPVKGARLINGKFRKGFPESDRLNRFCLYALSAYAPFGPQHPSSSIPAAPGNDNRIESLLLLHDPKLEILSVQSSTAMQIPAHILFVEHLLKEVVLTIRGSAELADWLIDFTCETTKEGFHRGMAASAQALDKRTFPLIVQALRENEDYSLFFTGHSLGGGIASLLTVMWCETKRSHIVSRDRLQAYAFGPPCVIARKQADQYADVIVSVIYGRDIVARMSRGIVKQGAVALKVLSKAVESSGGSWSSEGPPQKSSGGGGDIKLNFPISLAEALELSLPFMKEQKLPNPPYKAHPDARAFFPADGSVHCTSRTIEKSSAKQRSEAEAVSILHHCHEVFQEQARLNDYAHLVPAGRVLQAVPREHAVFYKIKHSHADVYNDVVLLEMASSWAGHVLPIIHVDAVSDHHIDKYAMAFCPEIMTIHTLKLTSERPIAKIPDLRDILGKRQRGCLPALM